MIGKFFLLFFFFCSFTQFFSQQQEVFGSIQGPDQVEWTHGFVFLPGNYPLMEGWRVSNPEVLDQKDFQFVPLVIALTQGQKLKIKNSDYELHNVHGYGENGLTRFNVPVLAQMRHSILVEKAEVIDIFCDIHAQMRAYILCLENPYFRRLNSDGSFELKSLPDQANQLMFWHPYLEPRQISIPLKKEPILIQTTWRLGYTPKKENISYEFTVHSFQEIVKEISFRLQEIPQKNKEEGYAILDNCYFTFYEAGGMETAVRFHLSGREAFLHEQLFRDIKNALKLEQKEKVLYFVAELTKELTDAAEELQVLGIQNKSEYSTGSIDLNQKTAGNEYLKRMTTRKLFSLFSETENLELPAIILQTLFERKQPYLERFLKVFEELSSNKQIVLLKHLALFAPADFAQKKLEESLSSPSWLLRSVALETLRLFPNTLEFMKQSIEDSSPVVRQKAVQGWILQSKENALQMAKIFLQNPDPDLRLAAIYGLIEIAKLTKNEVALKEIQETLLAVSSNADNRPDVRLEIWKYLGTRCKAQWLYALCEENPNVRENVLLVAILHNWESTFFMQDALSDFETRVRLNALIALKNIPQNGPIVERCARWIAFLMEDSDPNISQLARSFILPEIKDFPQQDLAHFLNAYASGHLRSAYFLLSVSEKQKQPFSLFAKSYWMNSSLSVLFSQAKIQSFSEEDYGYIAKVQLGNQLFSFQLIKEGLFWKINQKF